MDMNLKTPMEALEALFSCLKPRTDVEAKTQIRNFVMLCDGLRAEAIIRACFEFMDGDVDGQSKRFAPTPTEFVEVAKRIDKLMGAVERAKNRPALPKPEETAPISQQERARVGAKMKAYCDELQAKSESMSTENTEFRQSLFDRGNKGLGSTALNILMQSGKIDREAFEREQQQ